VELLKGFFKRHTPFDLAIIAILSWFISTLISDNMKPRNDTDPADGRSGLALFVDNRTGCHYLSSPAGGLTPRLDSEGNQICSTQGE